MAFAAFQQTVRNGGRLHGLGLGRRHGRDRRLERERRVRTAQPADDPTVLGRPAEFPRFLFQRRAAARGCFARAGQCQQPALPEFGKRAARFFTARHRCVWDLMVEWEWGCANPSKEPSALSYRLGDKVLYFQLYAVCWEMSFHAVSSLPFSYSCSTFTVIPV